MSAAATPVREREIRAVPTERGLIVYQAYGHAIADAALAAQTLVSPFRRGRMTWIKPSFLWMASRCGWASKPDQERVLAIEITLDGWWWALGHACLSHFDPRVHESHDVWAASMARCPVRVQWDPDRGLRHEPLERRAIQVGLSGDAVDRYVDEWIVSIVDVTDVQRRVGSLVAERRDQDAVALLPHEPALVPPQAMPHIGL